MAPKNRRFGDNEIPIFENALVYKRGEYWKWHSPKSVHAVQRWMRLMRWANASPIFVPKTIDHLAWLQRLQDASNSRD
jgi:hypothetical protein